MGESWKSRYALSVLYVTTMLICTVDCKKRLKEESAAEMEENSDHRAGKLFSMFQVVTFPNDACSGGSKNGTCYTAAECTNKGGIKSGTCASGYGVCCIFSINCGSTSGQNNTYIESNSISAGACKTTICPCGNNICQLRLDFTSFVLTGPSTSTLSTETAILNGAPVKAVASGEASSFASRCLTDTFAVTNSGGTNTPVICGTNTGQHMYVDVDQSDNHGCNDFVFQLGTMGVFATIPTRQWSIKVTQYTCDSPVRAPSGCTQYFFNSADVVKTYNFDGGQHLAYQKQTICVRRAKGTCRICWTATSAKDFAVSGMLAVAATSKAGSGITKSTLCCGGGAMGKNTKGYDCVQIPGALKATGTKISKAMLMVSRFCGRNVGLATINAVMKSTAAGANKTICSTVIPFYIRFLSDGYEEAMAAKENLVPNKGFRLAYTQDAKNCV